MTEKIPSYGKIWALGSQPVRELFLDPVVIQEKVDGSQISWRVDYYGDLEVKSKNVQLDLASAGMFQAGVDELLKRIHCWKQGHIYRGEYLQKPKHNHIKYDRLPAGHIVLWDVEGPDGYLTWEEVEQIACAACIDPVKTYFYGMSSMLDAEQYLGRPAAMGADQPAEGIVIKNYERFDTKLGTPLFAKLVRAEYKEGQKAGWKIENPSGTDIRKHIGQALQNPARWSKAVQYLKETGEHTGTVKDIGKLMQRVSTDIDEEMRDEVQEMLMKWGWKEIKRIGLQGIAEWYKSELTKGDE